ncbi:MAG: hypothetical protein JNM34_03570 [Chthonomonadaceae bacterium]|nr:hypothetical protein [Chthonomonadaceae bacterium]
MVRVLTSLVLIGGTLAYSLGQGRFFGSDLPKFPGFQFSSEGFKSAHPGSDLFKFPTSVKFVRQSASPEGAYYVCDHFRGGPSSIGVNLRAMGFEAYFANGIDLRLTSLSGPLLTVMGASFGPETPAPASRWVLVSFADQQPPLLISFLGQPPEIVVSGSSGDWHVKSSPFVGWARFSLPFGIKPKPANNVSTLGQMATDIKHREFLYIEQAPKLVSQKAERSPNSVDVTYEFDRPGAALPPAIGLAKLGGYAVKVFGDVADLRSTTEEGPVLVARRTTVKVRFPFRGLKAGVPLVWGRPEGPQAPKREDTSIALSCTAAQLALQLWFPDKWSNWAQSQLKAPEPARPDVAASRALLWRAVNREDDEAAQNINPALDRLIDRMDPMTWKIWEGDELIGRRASALSCLAAAIDGRAKTQAAGCALQAGLRARTVLVSYKSSHGLPAEQELRIEPMLALRKTLFEGGKPDAFSATLFSDVRLVGQVRGGFVLTKVGAILSWDAGDEGPGWFRLTGLRGLAVDPRRNLSDLTVDEQEEGSRVQFQAKARGSCSLSLSWEKSASPIMKAVLPPAYREVVPNRR